MNRFSFVTGIEPDNRTSYEGRKFLTIDIDWAHDDILSDCIDLVEEADIPATWYVTHNTPLLRRLEKNPKFELGIHPNFNCLLEGDTRKWKNSNVVLDEILNIVPLAKTIRSHSLTQSERLLELFGQKGLTHVLNTYIPISADMVIRPWKLWSKIVIAPHCFQDNVEIRLHNRRMNIRRDGLHVFNFHPIHIFLNTENMERYEATRSLHFDPSRLIHFRSEDPLGARALFKELIGL